MNILNFIQNFKQVIESIDTSFKNKNDYKKFFLIKKQIVATMDNHIRLIPEGSVLVDISKSSLSHLYDSEIYALTSPLLILDDLIIITTNINQVKYIICKRETFDILANSINSARRAIEKNQLRLRGSSTILKL